ncbi:MAG: inorganic phosphate transporter, partial [Alphaproteobacteria bacterium]|nr:inorganic phosphate transporter [Alphaproteobacteria bacterium]
VNWASMGAIAASWVISPLLGGIVAALFLAFIKTFIIYQDDKIAAARRWVPMLIGVMSGAFAAYLAMKGLNNVIRLSVTMIALIALVAFVISWAIVHPLIRKQSEGLENRNQSLRQLFHLPLIFSAALLSFAHGANDVANAIGPLAAILAALSSGSIETRAVVPFWVMLIGAAGLSLGLFLYGPRLIRTVGEQITRMNPMRAYCVALSAAITVILASWFGLPVSSTHIAVGAVFGVGFFREYYTARSKRRRRYVRARGKQEAFDLEEVSRFEEMQRRKLVRRSHFTTIIAAWIITVPAAAGLAILIFLVLRFIG